MFTYQGKQRTILFIGGLVSASLFFAFLVMNGRAQQDITGTTLLKEYFLPVQALAPVDAGAITVNGNECATAGSGDCVGHDVDETLGYGTAIDSNLGYKKTSDGLMMEKDGSVSYKVTVVDPASYQLKLTAKNASDSLDGLTRSQYDTIKGDIAAQASDPTNPISGYNADDFVTFGKDLFGTVDANREMSFRQLRFLVKIRKEGDANDTVVGGVRVADRNQFATDAIDLGQLEPGSFTITLQFLNDISIAYPGANSSCASTPCDNFTVCGKDASNNSVCMLPGADDGDGILNKTPVIKELKLSKTQFTNDVLGVRVYTNPDHLSALDWYNQKLVNPGTPVAIPVDGYRGVIDGRTAYINAANINDKGVFYTNIYVIAYNINASPATVEIFNQIVNNWQFNVNLSSGLNDLEKDRIKNQLRRDTARLEDVNQIRAILDGYKLRNQKYPDLKSGTFVAGHAFSTWPSWQSVLGAQLGVALPQDPINEMAVESYPSGSSIASEPRQYDCTSDSEKQSCETVCTRDAQQNPLTGCKANQQCVQDKYCSLIPPGYDPVTGWNQTSQQLAFSDPAVTGKPADPGYPLKFGTYSEGSYNTNGRIQDDPTLGAGSKYKDDAFVYQYTSVNGGDSYILNYRLEYSAHCLQYDAAGSCVAFTAAKCAPNQCFFETSNSCYNSGQALFSELKPEVAYGFNETKGSSTADLTGGNHTGFFFTPLGAATPNPMLIENGHTESDTAGGTTSQSVVFKAVDFMNSTPLNLPAQDNFAVAMVFKPLTLPSAGATAILAGTSTQRLLSMSTSAAGTTLTFTPNGSTSISIPTDMKILNGTSYHVIASYQKNSADANYTASLKVNGVQVASKTDATGQSFAVELLRLGAGFNGSMDSFALYTRVIGDTEAYTLFTGNDSYLFDKYRNTYCFAGLFVNSCGNGIVQLDAGEQCEPSIAGTNSNYCDATYGPEAWYNKNSVNPGCTSSCETVTSTNVGQLPVPYDPQQPALSCGGYCGDSKVQFEANEQCDQGTAGGAIPLPNRGGSGGVGPDSQYLCTGIQSPSVAPITFFNAPQILTIDGNNPSPVKTVSQIVTMPANTTLNVSFNLAVGAGQQDDSNVIDVLLEELNENNTLVAAHRKSITIDNPNDLRNLTFASRSTTAKARLTFTLSSNLTSVTATVDGISVTTVNGCRTFGGYCGDGSVQSLFSEQCDILSYRTPTPAQSVNQFINPGFESGLTNWNAVDAIGLPLSAISAQNVNFSIERQDAANIQSGKASLIFKPSNTVASGDTVTPGIKGLGQYVYFSGSTPTNAITIAANVWAKRIINGNPAPALKVRAFQYNPESGTYVNFTSGNCTIGSDPSLCLEADLTMAANGLTDQYKLFTSSPIAVPPSTASNTNAVTFLSIMADTSDSQAVMFFDDAAVISNYRLQYSCGKKGNQSCQLIGGYCGDGTVQGSYGESCDEGALNGINGNATISNTTITLADGSTVAVKLLNGGKEFDINNDGAADGFIQTASDGSKHPYSYCTAQCSRPYCGDGITGVNGNTLTPELCDPSNPLDPQAKYCENSCMQKKLGGSCTSNTQCTTGTVCAGPSGSQKCVLLPGQRGCFADSDCLTGLTCDPQRNICLVPTDQYLKYHLDAGGFPSDPNTYTSLTPVFTCPYTSIISRLDTPVVLDGCTGLEFRTLDLPINTKVTHDQAAEACRTGGSGFALPAARELLALVSPLTYTDQSADGSSSKTPNNYLKLCSVNGMVTSKGGDDSCIEGGATEQYLYWTDTKVEGKKACSITTSKTCIQDSDCPLVDGTSDHESCSIDLYYAVNFKKGSLEVYPANTLMRSRCVSSSTCGNGTIEGDEQCDFNAQGGELIGSASCQDKGFSGGNVHCDPVSCRLRYDNCLAVTKPATSSTTNDALTCEQACENIGHQNFQIKQCSQIGSNGVNHGCTDNTQCAGVCNQGSCSNDPGLSCSTDAQCNFGLCQEALVTSNTSGLVAPGVNQETYPSKLAGQESTDYSVNLDSTIQTLQVAGTNDCGSQAVSSTPVVAGKCDIAGIGSQKISTADAPAQLCTCKIPNPTYFSNTIISITNQTTQGILALDAFQNFQDANRLAAALPSPASATDADIANYVSAQAFLNTLPGGYPQSILNDPNQPQSLKTQINTYLNTSPYDTAQQTQDVLNTFAAGLASNAVTSAPTLAQVPEGSIIKKLFISVVTSIKRLFGISASAVVDPQTAVNQAMTVINSLQPASVHYDYNNTDTTKRITRADYVSLYANKPATGSWPLLTDVKQLSAFKLHWLSQLAIAQARIDLKNLDTAVNDPTTGIKTKANVTRDDVTAQYAVAKAISDNLNVGPTANNYIDDSTTRTDLQTKSTGLINTITNIEVTENCSAPSVGEDAVTNFDWTYTDSTKDKYRISYNGTDWSTVPATKYDTGVTQYQCHYQCSTGYHVYGGGLCAQDACLGDTPVAQQQATGSDSTIVQAGVNKGAATTTTGPALTWAFKDGVAQSSLNACEWSCPSGSFKDPASNTCLSQCTNVCDPNKVIATPDHATAITTVCSTSDHVVGCSDSSAVYDFKCDLTYIKSGTSCQACPVVGGVQQVQNSDETACVTPCANYCGNLTPLASAPAHGTLVATQCSTVSGGACNSSVTNDYTCAAGYTKTGGKCMWQITNLTYSSGYGYASDSATRSHLCAGAGLSNVGSYTSSGSSCFGGVASWNGSTYVLDNAVCWLLHDPSELDSLYCY